MAPAKPRSCGGQTERYGSTALPMAEPRMILNWTLAPSALPKQHLLTTLSEPESAELIERHIDFIDGTGRSVHLASPFVRHTCRETAARFRSRAQLLLCRLSWPMVAYWPNRGSIANAELSSGSSQESLR